MTAPHAFVLLDDARAQGASDARLFADPRALFIARRAEEVGPALAAADAALAEHGGALAGYIAYEAGLALEPQNEMAIAVLAATLPVRFDTDAQGAQQRRSQRWHPTAIGRSAVAGLPNPLSPAPRATPNRGQPRNRPGTTRTAR